jgi:hypothetical protein
MSSAATLFSTARSDHPEHHSGHGGKVFAIKPEWCSASNRNSVRDHRNAVRDQTGTLFGIARIPQPNGIAPKTTSPSTPVGVLLPTTKVGVTWIPLLDASLIPSVVSSK